MLVRRRPLNEWSSDRIREQILRCYVTDPDLEDVRACVLLEVDERLLPRNAARQAAEQAEEAGEPFDGLPPYRVYCFAFRPEDRARIFSEGEVAVTVHDEQSFHSRRAAAQHALRWVGDHSCVCDFEHVPGLYQAGLMEHITGRTYDIGMAVVEWVVPTNRGKAAVRRFPPPVESL
jgi:hypothetical protein